MESSPSPPNPPSEGSLEAVPAANGGAVSTSNGDGGEPGKLFVGGIPWGASEDALREYFGKYGDVTEAIIMKERGTGNARGFGFVSFSDPSSAEKAINDDAANHAILGRRVEVKRALPRVENQHRVADSPHQSKPSNRTAIPTTSTKKIFVGGLAANLTQEEFRAHFEKFGQINDVVVMYDPITHRPRGFGFITFESEDSADVAVETTFQNLNGKTVEVKRAIPRDGNGGDSTPARDNNNSYYTNPFHGLRNGNSRGPILDAYSPGVYPAYSPRLPGFPGYGAATQPPYPPFAFGAGYGFGVPYAGPRRGWNGAGGYVVPGRRGPLIYGAGNASFFPGYFPHSAPGFFPAPTSYGTQVYGKRSQVYGGGGHVVGVAGHEENGKAEDR